MAAPDPGTVEERLDDVIDPCSAANGTNLSIVDMGLIRSLDVEDGHVAVDLYLTTPGCMMLPYFHDEITDAVGSLPGVESVEVTTDSGFEWRPGMMTDEARRARKAHLEDLEETYGADDDVADRIDLLG